MIDEIDGLQELLAACVKIEKETAKRIEKAIKPVMEALNAEAKSAAPFDTGSLQQSFDFKTKIYGGNFVFGIQGPSISNGEFNTDKGKRVPWRYFHLVDGGTVERKTAKGYKRGAVKANNFYESLMKKYDKIIKETIQKVLDEIESEIP